MTASSTAWNNGFIPKKHSASAPVRVQRLIFDCGWINLAFREKGQRIGCLSLVFFFYAADCFSASIFFTLEMRTQSVKISMAVFRSLRQG